MPADLGPKQKRKLRCICAAILGAFACINFCACAAQENADIYMASPEGGYVEVMPDLRRNYPKGDTAPLVIERGYEEFEAGHVLYPKVIAGAHAKKINESICRSALHYAKEDGQIFTEYRVENNDDGLYSIMLYVRDLQSDGFIAQLPMTFDTASGELCDISYFFDPNSDAWRSDLAVLAQEAAKADGLALLKDIPPVEDGQMYYIKEGDIVLLYRVYEYTSYTEEWPAFKIPIEAVKKYLAEGSPLLRLLA